MCAMLICYLLQSGQVAGLLFWDCVCICVCAHVSLKALWRVCCHGDIRSMSVLVHALWNVHANGSVCLLPLFLCLIHAEWLCVYWNDGNNMCSNMLSCRDEFLFSQCCRMCSSELVHVALSSMHSVILWTMSLHGEGTVLHVQPPWPNCTVTALKQSQPTSVMQPSATAKELSVAVC